MEVAAPALLTGSKLIGLFSSYHCKSMSARSELVFFKAMLHADLLEFYMQTYSISANKIINSEKFPLNLAPFLFVRVGTFFTSLFT